jgi:glycine cleavage system P protein (glycine dehydrogenase)
MDNTATRPALDTLESNDEFLARHIGPDLAETRAMLAELGCDTLDELADRAVPPDIRVDTPLALGKGCTEADVLSALRAIGDQNELYKSFIGTGYYGTHTPSVILRNVLENPAWYTAYTPYQPEISQGRLEVLLNFQTMISDLTGLEIANASLLDEGTATAEAMAFCHRVSKSQSDRFFVARDCLPQTIDVLRTRAEPLDIEIVVGNPKIDIGELGFFGALLQYPGVDGDVRDHSAVIEKIHATGGLVVVAADLLSLALLRPPGELGADVAVGSSQRFGVPMGYGGPHAAYFATHDAHKRMMPGRIVGVSIDSHGAPAYRLALQTREQHIRREKATSNICTAQVLLAEIAALYCCYHGPKGLARIAERIHRLTAILAAGLEALGLRIVNETAFDTLTVATPGNANRTHGAAREARCNLRAIDDDHVGISLDETTTRADVVTLWQIFAAALAQRAVPDFETIAKTAPEMIPAQQRRHSTYLTHPVFNTNHSETRMMRYLRKLAGKDLALDRTMIPLGSCTMKLNAATEMLAITWPEFASLHPFVPPEQAEGYAALIRELELMLCACTGYDAVSLQPNAGSQGEYAGLLAIRAYHTARGEAQRTVCLIPSSAHGTNPASAHMAGLQVVVVKCDDHGNIDIADLAAKAEQYATTLGAIMITYPSTHGVYESSVREVCNIVHAAGGQVYVDGANLNALVGLSSLAAIGGDVSHINLHKTFCIPHGGGGPGVGPVCVKAHLKDHLPGYPRAEIAGGTPIASAAYGSASILPISWAYIKLMGRDGLRRATQVAILNANYIAHRLKPHFPVLYTGRNGLVAHECIIDLRPTKERTGITVEDVAKRLIDYGFHAPTMSFPVAGTLMIEPTESESKYELDRFCDALIAIRAEIDAVEAGRYPANDNPLVNAPHTSQALAGDWPHPYSRAEAAFPAADLREAKYWSPVGRIDNAYGDRNLVCACPPVSSYE